MKDNTAIMVTAFLAFAAFLFWAGMAHPQEQKPKSVIVKPENPPFQLDYTMTLENGNTFGGSIPFQNLGDCLLVARHLNDVALGDIGLRLSFNDVCEGEKQ